MNKNILSKKTADEELVFDLEVKTKEEALIFLYRAGIVTKKGNLRKFYRNTSKPQTA